MAQTYKDLIIWRKSIALVMSIYKLTALFPREKLFGLTSQMRRSAVSIPSNIAEGQARLTPGKFRQFLSQAGGSLAELEIQMIIASSLGFVRAEEEDMSTAMEEIARMLNALITSIQARSAFSNQEPTTNKLHFLCF